MDIREYIASGIIESYALGMVNDQERREVECMSQIYPELYAHLLDTQKRLEDLSRTWSKEPPVELKNKVMGEINKEASKEKQSSFAKRRAKVIRMQRAKQGKGINARSVAAASVILVLAAGALFFWKNNQLGETQSELAALNEKTKANDELVADLNKKLEAYDAKEAFLTDDNTRIVSLKGTAISPDARVKVYWNQDKGKVMLMGMNLPQQEIDKQYQLWAIVGGKPIDLGVLDANNPNEPTSRQVKTGDVQAFAITLEAKGGNPEPNLDQLYVIGDA